MVIIFGQDSYHKRQRGTIILNLTKTINELTVIEKPGSVSRYKSGDTEVLSLILAKVTGKSLSDYASEKIWSKVGAESNVLWCLDHKDGIEKAYCCFNSNARDFARFGKLMLQNGKWNGNQVVPEAWVEDCLTPCNIPDDYGHNTDYYGYQWWLMEYKGYKMFYQRGLNGQYIVNIPALNLTWVRLGEDSAPRTEFKKGGVPRDEFFACMDAAINLWENKLLTFCIAFSGISFCFSQELDPQFGNKGICTQVVTSSVGQFFVPVKTLYTLDDKFIVGGILHSEGAKSSADILFYKLSNKGIFDNTFGTNGKLIINNAQIDNLSDFECDAQGNIVVVGSNGNNSDNYFINKYLSNGTPTNITFQKIAFGASLGSSINGVKILGNSIYVGGWNQESNVSIKGFVAKYNLDGKLDNTFGNKGLQEITYSTHQFQFVKDIEANNNGYLTILGFYKTKFTSSKSFVTQISEIGTINKAFGVNGFINANLDFTSILNFSALKLVFTPHNTYLLAGSTEKPENSTETNFLSVTNVNSTGTPIPTFANKGVYSTPTSNESFSDLELLDSLILLSYKKNEPQANSNFAIKALNTKGNLNSKFGTNGIFSLKVGSFNQLYNITSITDSSLVATGISDGKLILFKLILRKKQKLSIAQELKNKAVGQTLVAQNLNFEKGKSEITQHSFKYLDEIVEFLKQNPNVSIAIEGHTEQVGDPIANQNLSIKRAETVENYLIEKGIKANRLTAQGFGSNKPLSKDNQTLNRRVELRIIKK